MNKKLLLVIITLTVLALTGSALALGPMGPPTAGLKMGQFGIAAEYGYGNTDMKISGSGVDDTLDNVKSNAFVAQPGFGVTDDWEVYALLGVADTRFGDFDDGYKSACGFGTKITFLKETDRSWGAMFEMAWRSADDSGADIDYYEMTVAVGPTLKITDSFRIYGGPFFYFINGDIDIDNGDEPLPEQENGSEFNYDIRNNAIRALSLNDVDAGSYDLEAKSNFGGYIGAELDLNKNTSWYNEFQFSGTAWAFGTGVGWKF